MTNVDARLLLGAGVILLALSLVNGFLIEAMPLVRLALSAHLVGLLGSAFLIGLGANWPVLGLARWRPQSSQFPVRAHPRGWVAGWLFVGRIALAWKRRWSMARTFSRRR